MINVFSHIIKRLQGTAKEITSEIPMINEFIQSEFTPKEIVDLYNAHAAGIKTFKPDNKKDAETIEIVSNLKQAFEILEKAKGSDDQLTLEHVKKMELKMLEKVQGLLKEAVNSFVKYVTRGNKEKVFDTEEYNEKASFEKYIGESHALSAKLKSRSQ